MSIIKTLKLYEIRSKLTIRTPERHHSGIFVVNFEHISHLFLVLLLPTLNKSMSPGFMYSETYLGTFRTSIMKLFAKITPERSKLFLHQKLHHRCLIGSCCIRILYSIYNYLNGKIITSKTKGRSSQRVLQENKTRWIFRKTKHFLRICVRIRVKKYLFSKNLVGFVFL